MSAAEISQLRIQIHPRELTEALEVHSIKFEIKDNNHIYLWQLSLTLERKIY